MWRKSVFSIKNNLTTWSLYKISFPNLFSLKELSNLFEENNADNLTMYYYCSGDELEDWSDE